MTDWSKAPDWADYHATDANGNTYWYEKRPDKVKLHGWANQPTSRAEPDNTAFPHWEETLEERPKKPELKVGGVYRTRDGDKAWILHENSKSKSPMNGVVLIDGEGLATVTWTRNGSLYCSPESFLDLVEEWKE